MELTKYESNGGILFAKLKYLQYLLLTVKLLKIRTSKKYTVIQVILNFDPYGFFIQKCIQMMQMEW